MRKIDYQISFRKGFSTFIILLILAVLSSSIVGVSVNKTHRQLSALTAQQHTFAAETYAASLLNDIIFDHFAFGAHQHTLNNNLGWDFISTEMVTPISIKNKPFQKVALSITANHSSRASFTYSVNMLKSRRLENIPNSALEHWSPEEIHLLTQHYFNTDEHDFLSYHSTAKYTAGNCDSLTPEHTGLLWIKGDCELASLHLGQTLRPVMLVIEEGAISLNQASVTGLVIHLCGVSESHSFLLNTDSDVIGGVLSLCTPPSNSLALQFNSDVLNTVQSHQDNVLTSIMEGSWLKQ
ncbi:hypothetical protein J3L16_06440 [Alteromonas sp. 5E99-2]|uniref:hypothetical protein n=1 Tax=Alteromonas sp. 5E99-2 TaxID=2817683 RepID=UPI001A988B95|nr:hypothetical protein [Alteromonas sp. 5E99-2]MBO1255324.1 hypothetical protein [Alteromonas sp. 5E99-2]